VYILDTNILRYYLTQPHNYPYMTAQIDRADLQHLLCITIVNAQELMAFGASLVRDRPDQRENIVLEGYRRIRGIVEILKRFYILPFDGNASERFRTIGEVQTAIATRDRRIAAIGLAHRATVVTANTRHFNLVPGLDVADWTITPPS
jgi:predicted nucleic acid-binding protein